MGGYYVGATTIAIMSVIIGIMWLVGNVRKPKKFSEYDHDLALLRAVQFLEEDSILFFLDAMVFSTAREYTEYEELSIFNSLSELHYRELLDAEVS